eukprot:scaffold368_cov258-Pinguiococcus_pyrenoidosus.AAC.44
MGSLPRGQAKHAHAGPKRLKDAAREAHIRGARHGPPVQLVGSRPGKIRSKGPRVQERDDPIVDEQTRLLFRVLPVRVDCESQEDEPEGAVRDTAGGHVMDDDRVTALQFSRARIDALGVLLTAFPRVGDREGALFRRNPVHEVKDQLPFVHGTQAGARLRFRGVPGGRRPAPGDHHDITISHVADSSHEEHQESLEACIVARAHGHLQDELSRALQRVCHPADRALQAGVKPSVVHVPQHLRDELGRFPEPHARRLLPTVCLLSRGKHRLRLLVGDLRQELVQVDVLEGRLDPRWDATQGHARRIGRNLLPVDDRYVSTASWWSGSSAGRRRGREARSSGRRCHRVGRRPWSRRRGTDHPCCASEGAAFGARTRRGRERLLHPFQGLVRLVRGSRLDVVAREAALLSVGIPPDPPVAVFLDDFDDVSNRHAQLVGLPRGEREDGLHRPLVDLRRDFARELRSARRARVSEGLGDRDFHRLSRRFKVDIIGWESTDATV